MDDSRDRAQALLALAQLQQRSGAALTVLMKSGERPPDRAYEEFCTDTRRFVSKTAAFEQRWPGSFSVETAARPLVQQLLIYADHLQADGNVIRAQRCRDEAGELTSRYLGPVAAAEVARGQAKDAAAVGRFHEALVTLEEVRATFTAAGETLATAQTVLELANVYEWLGDYERALAAFRSVHDAVAASLRAGPPTEAEVGSALGRQVTAIMQGQASREGEDAMALRRIAYEILQGEGRVNRFLGHYTEAEGLLRQVREFAASFGVLAGIDYHLAAIACAVGRLDEAEALLTRIAPDFERPMIRPRRPALRLLQADILLGRDRPGAAVARLDDGVADLASHPDLDLAWKLQWRRGRALTALGQPATALAAYHAGGSAADELRKAPLGYRLDTTYLRDKLPMFHAAIDLAVQRGDAASAIWFIELVKARALSATLSVPRTGTGRSADPDRFDALSARLDALEFEAYSGAGSAATVRRRQELLAERDDLLERIRIHDPRWRNMTQPVPLDITSLAARLSGSERAVLTLFYRPGQIIAGVLGDGHMAVDRRILDPGVEERLHTVAVNLRKLKPDYFLFDVSAETGITITDLVPSAIIERAAAAPALLIAPHGILHLLPWSALTLGSEPLFQRTAVGMLPNVASFPLLDAEPVADPGVMLLGDPSYAGLTRYHDLRQAGPELDDVEALYGPLLRTAPRRREQATEAAFWELARRRDAGQTILHIACHGTLEAAEPMTSGLLLTRSKVDAGELVTRQVGTPEVILSACCTGWRPQATHNLDLAGDDALGLTASFLEAGARFVLVSVPLADEDATRAFTVAWHRQRRAQATPLQAFRAAQQEMLAGPYAPWRWAGMAAYGCR